MAYITDMTKRPVEMLLGLLNDANNLGLVEADVAILPPQPFVGEVGDIQDTSVQIDLLTMPSEVEGDYVEFTYKRIDLTELFSVINPNFREVDVPLNVNGLPEDNAVFFAEILRKFGVAMTDADFTVAVQSAGVLRVSAKAENLAYTNHFDIAVVDSLATRVATNLLNGFEAPAPAAP
jgi:hypothetical protein